MKAFFYKEISSSEPIIYSEQPVNLLSPNLTLVIC